MNDDFEIVGRITVDPSGSMAIEGLSGQIDRVGDSTSALGRISDYVWGQVIFAGIQMVVGAIGDAIGAIGDFFSSSVDSAMESQEVMANVAATVRSTGMAAGYTAEELAGMAEGLQQVTRFSDETILRGQAMLLTFVNIGHDVFPMATEAMLDLAEKFGSVDSAAIQLGKALQDPIAGVSALRRVGVMLTEEQEESIKAFMEQGDIASAQRVILEELSIEVGGLAFAMGDTLAGQMTIATNRLDNFKELVGGPLFAVMTQFRMNIMGAIMDSQGFVFLTDFLTRINELLDSGLGLWDAIGMTIRGIVSDNPLVSWFANLEGGVSTLGNAAVAFANGSIAFQQFTQDFNDNTSFLGQWRDALLPFRDIIIDVADAFINLGISLSEGGGLEAVRTFFGEITAAISETIDRGGLTWLTDAFTVLKNVIDTVAGALVNTGLAYLFLEIGRNLMLFWDGVLLIALRDIPLVTIFGSLGTVLSTILTVLGPIALGIAGLAGGLEIASQLLGDDVVPSFQELSDIFLTWIDSVDWQALSDNIVAGIQAIDWQAVGAAATNALALIPITISRIEINWGSVLGAVWEGLIQLAMGIIDAGANLLVEYAPSWEAAGTAAVNAFFTDWEASWTSAIRDFLNDLEIGITNGVRDFFNNWEMNWTNWVREKIINPIKNALGIRSPSTVFMEIGQSIIEGLVAGIRSIAGSVYAAFQTVIDRLMQIAQPVLNFFGLDGNLGTSGTVSNGPGGLGGLSGYSPGGGLAGSGEEGCQITNIFYGDVYVGSMDDLYCPTPNPLTSATSGQVGGAGAGTQFRGR